MLMYMQIFEIYRRRIKATSGRPDQHWHYKWLHQLNSGLQDFHIYSSSYRP